jgi:C-5 cytosine-specific DNA methylase/Transposase C of IS166 homeodomain
VADLQILLRENQQNFQEALSQKEQALAQKEEKIAQLTHQLYLFRNARFGRKSEQQAPDAQMRLFDEAYDENDKDSGGDESDKETITYICCIVQLTHIHFEKGKKNEQMKFIDLFAGLGGFHQALSQCGARCVFASEIDHNLSSLYEKNFGIRPEGDIRTVDLTSIPAHDILCAGFPCQPFSKAGEQKGLECPQWGDLFDYVVTILKLKKPRYFIIENVPNLIRHKNGKTWALICSRLRKLGYDISFNRLSPHMFGIPQKRERAFIVGDLRKLDGFKWPIPKKLPEISIHTILDDDPEYAQKLNKNHILYLETWQDFISAFPKNEDMPSFPIWAMEFGANYPLDGPTPYKKKYKGVELCG